MRVKYTVHAEAQLRERVLGKSVVERVLRGPDQVVLDRKGRRIAQSIVRMDNIKFLLRVVFIRKKDVFLVITVYRTTKIDKYWVNE